jgi:hypothetical protein
MDKPEHVSPAQSIDVGPGSPKIRAAEGASITHGRDTLSNANVIRIHPHIKERASRVAVNVNQAGHHELSLGVNHLFGPVGRDSGLYGGDLSSRDPNVTLGVYSLGGINDLPILH